MKWPRRATVPGEPHGGIMGKCKILFLAANPPGTTPLALDKEIREIEAKIRASECRDELQLVSRWAVRADNLLQALLELCPQIVHFSGHGTEDAIVLMDDQDQPKLVDKQAIVYLFGALQDDVRLILLNACFSRLQAESLAEQVGCVIGMNRPIGDQAAIVFAASFYRALGFRRSVREAFDLGKAALMLQGIPEDSTPELITRDGVDPGQIVLVQGQVTGDVANETKGKSAMNDHSNSSVSIGGNATGNVIQTGNHNVAHLTFTKTTLPPPTTVDIHKELAGLRELLSRLNAPDQKKIDRAVEDLQDELAKPEPNRDEIGSALDRALAYSQRAEGFAAVVEKLQGHVTNAVAWLGDQWHKLLPLVGLML
jgi:hypothetical protein